MAKQQPQKVSGTQAPVSSPPIPLLQPRAFSAIEQPAFAESPQADVQSKSDEVMLGHSLGRINTRPLSHLPIQPKLTIGQVGDPYEQEADRVAAQVVAKIHAPEPQSTASPKLQSKAALRRKSLEQSIQRQESSEEEELQMKPATSIQRQEMPEEEALQMKPAIQRRTDVGGMAASTDLESSINQARGGGQSISNAIRQPMEQAFGADFSSVKVHTDSQSDQLSRSINAKAFTTKNDIFFSGGAYNPGDRGGQELLAHELTHVVQQGGASIQRKKTPSLTQAKSNPSNVVQRLIDAPTQDKNAQKTKGSEALTEDRDDKSREALGSGGEVTFSTTGEALGSRGDLLKISGQEQSTAEDATGTGFSMANSLFSVGFAIKQFGGAKDLADKASAILSGAGGLVGIGETISKAVKLGTGADDKSSSAAAADILGATGAGFSTLIGLVKSVSKIKDVFKEDDTKNETAFEKKMNAGSSVFQAIQSGMSLAQKVLQITEASGASAMLQYALPGIGLVISACELIMRAYGIVKAVTSFRAMSAEKKARKQALSQNKDAKQFFGKTFFGNTSTNLDKLDEVLADPSLLSSVPSEIQPQLKEYHLVHEMKYINQKRIVRESLLVGAELLKVGGEIAIISGAGAGVGVGLKGGATGMKAGMSVVRGAKQAYRDKYDTDSRKTSSAKHKRRIQHAQMIFDMIEQAHATKPKKQEDVQAHLDKEKLKIDTFLQAAGVHNLETWYANAGKLPDGPQNAFVALCSAMQKRQFG
ncbi:MAG: DUF4157 domain-containing protein [Leptolyngbya sp. BL-A-14]